MKTELEGTLSAGQNGQVIPPAVAVVLAMARSGAAPIPATSTPEDREAKRTSSKNRRNSHTFLAEAAKEGD